MDQKDRLLLAELQANARLSLSELARRLNLSRATIQNRLALLEDRRVIVGYTLRLGEGALGQNVSAQVMLKITPKAQTDVVTFCRKYPAIVALHAISGDYDLAATIKAENTTALDDILDGLGRHPGVERTQTYTILSTKFERPQPW